MLRRIILMLAAMVLSAGCASQPSALEDALPRSVPLTPHVPIFSEETGAVIVHVMTEELVPIGGAIVELTDAQLVTESNGLGEAFFDSVLPGESFLVVNASGFHPWAQEINIASGRSQDIRAILMAASKKVPYSSYVEKSGTWQCTLGIANSNTGCWPQDQLPGARELVDISLDPGWNSTLIEAVTAPASATGGRGFSVQVGGHRPNETTGTCFAQVYQLSPTRIELFPNRRFNETKCQLSDVPIPDGPYILQLRPSPWLGPQVTNIHVTMQQKWTVHATTFYLLPHSEDYSTLPDS